MCNPDNSFVGFGEKSLKKVTCELIEQAKITNNILSIIANRMSGSGSGSIAAERFKADEQAFLTYWTQSPSSDQFGYLPKETIARRVWDAALNWERTKND